VDSVFFIVYVAICVRVGRQCHQSGGTDVVDLPDILLPEDQYLDMFDSESDIDGDNSDDELVESDIYGDNSDDELVEVF